MNRTPTRYDAVRASDAVVARLRARHPDLIDLTTGRILGLLEKLGRPQDRLPPVIHVAGTNGKGSVCAYLRAMAEAGGKTAHVMTSPHLVRFAERIRIAGQLITDEAMIELIERVETANGDDPISFFELTTAIALTAFSETSADVCIIEVGLGGRFDASNVFDKPAATVITPVDYDHLEMLGPEISRIAWEKAGIIKQGCPCIVARQPDEALAVIEAQAEKLSAPLTVMGREFDAFEERGRMVVQMEERLLDLPRPSLYGRHQIGNAGLAVAVSVALPYLGLEPDGIAQAVWPARFQRLTAGPLAKKAAKTGATLWLDGGHNPHAGAALAEALDVLLTRDPRPLMLVVGMLTRKDVKGFLEPFAHLTPRVFATTFASENAFSAAAIAAAARSVGLPVETCRNVTDAVEKAVHAGAAPPHVLICGALHFAGDVLAMSPETWPT